MVDDPKDMQAQVASRAAAEEAIVKERLAKEAAAPVIDDAFVEECMAANEVGDGRLFAALHRGKHVFNVKTKDEWLYFNGVHWVRDDNRCRALAAMEAVALRYEELTVPLWAERRELVEQGAKARDVEALQEKINAINARVRRCRSMRGRDNILRAAATIEAPLTCEYNDLDRDPMLLAGKNGVMDLRSGLLRPGRPEDFITKAIPHDLPDDLTIPAPRFEGFVRTCHISPTATPEQLQEGEEKLHYLHKLMGYAVTGRTNLRIFPIFYGPHGQNGKGTFMKIMYRVMGPLAGPIQTEMLIAQRNTKSSSGPSPDIMDIKGKRLIWASETEDGQRFASAKVKLLTGGDPLVGRAPNDRDQTTFDPSHLMFLIGNSLPGVPSHDDAFWTRTRVILWPFSFVSGRDPAELWERPADPDLEDALLAETKGIIAWLIRGCLLYQREGLTVPRCITEETAKYQKSEDLVALFVQDCLEVGSLLEVGATPLYNVFKAWWRATMGDRKVITNTKFGLLFTLKFAKQKGEGNKIFYQGVGLADNDYAKYADGELKS